MTSNHFRFSARGGIRGEIVEDRAPLVDVCTVTVLYLTVLVGDNRLDSFIPNAPGVQLRLIGVLTLLVLTVASTQVRLDLFLKPWTVAGFTWLCYMLLTSTWAPEGTLEYRSAVEELLWLFAIAATAYVAIGNCDIRAIPSLWKVIYYSGIAFAVAGLASGGGDQGRFAAFGGGPNTFVRIVFLAVIAAVVLTVARNRIGYLVPVPLLIAAVVLSGSRGGMISAAIVAVGLLWVLRSRLGSAKMLAGLGLVLAVLTPVMIFTRLGSLLAEMVSRRILEGAISEGNLSGRNNLYSEAIRVFGENPLWGVGAGGFAQLQQALPIPSHPHNIILSSLSEGGLIGGALLAVFIVSSLRPAVPSAEGSICRTGAIWASIFILLASQVSGYYFDFRMFFLFAAVAAVSGGVTKVRGECQ